MNLFIVPGNPPACYFYKLWAEEIQSEYAGCSVCISPYPRLLASGDSSKYLSDTVAAHARQLLAFHESVKKPVTIIGHSLGAWMALRLLDENSAIAENCLLLYPFLRMPSLKGRAILKSMQYLYRIPYIEPFLLGCRAIVQKFSEHLKYVTDEELRISLSMAYHEHHTIARYAGGLQIPEPLRKKLRMIYCDEDKWCTSDTVNEMKKWIACEKVDASHGFITSANERAIVSKALEGVFKLRS